MSLMRRCNSLISINVNGVQTEDVNSVCSAVSQHFQMHFYSVVANRYGIDDLSFKSISRAEGLNLINLFLYWR